MSMRPVFRVASAGLDPRDVRLIGIVFQHSQYNKYDFQMLDGLDLAGIDILIANPIDPRGLDAIASLAGSDRRIPSLNAVPRGAQATARYSVTIDRLTLQLLPTLNRMVETEGLEPSADAAPTPARDASSALAPEMSADAAAISETLAAPAAFPPDAAAPAGDVVGAALAGIPVLRSNPGALVEARLLTCEPASRKPSRALVPDLPADDGESVAVASASLAAANAIAVAARRAVDDPVELHSGPETLHWHGQSQQAPARARLQVLVVDPSPAAQQQLARALSRMGLEVFCTSGVAAAMQRIAAQYTDLVVTESALSDGVGFELIRRLRSQPAYRYTPVLLLRSRLHVLDATRARLAGDVTVLAKPLTRQALEALVRQVLRKSVILDDLSELLSPH